MKRFVTVVLAAAIAATCLPRAGHAVALGTAFTYQGSIDRSGVPPSDSCTFVFKLFDDALTGTQLGPTITLPVTLLQNGQFSVPLDFGVGMFDGNARWLDIAVHCPGDIGSTPLSPRQAITATPYALYALSGAGGGGGLVLPFVGPVTSSGQEAFRVQNNATTGDGSAIVGIANTSTGSAGGVRGVNNSNTGGTVGVWGVATASPVGTGVAGLGGATGGYFASNDAGASGDYAGVYGAANTHPGVKGVSNANLGVYGSGGLSGGYFYSSAAASTPNAAGVTGFGLNVDGVVGIATVGRGVWGTSGTGDGVSGSSTNGYGVVGSTNVATRAGVYGSSPAGDGVQGWTSGAFKSGVVGISNVAAGYGGYFKNAQGGTAIFVDGLSTVRTLAIIGGADLAERFDVRESSAPGTVMMIDESAAGTLRVADEPYSHRVAGVVSGANQLAAGVVLGEGEAREGTSTIALSGRVWVKCDATRFAIHPGDLLTTAGSPGYAMRARDRGRAYGAILGKAMTSLESGTGLVLVLVSLQ